MSKVQATMGAYIVLARKWRPAQFSDIVGQATVVQTLMNAIEQDRLHQAYLFTGSRGIGKTSIARIFAKVIRCPHRKKNEIASSSGTPISDIHSCDECASCKEITTSSSVDVIEIDGASNNGVDSIREIRENAKFLPAQGSKKIYIIDEVHMLTTAAFNALLKTLEEPPEHVIFIFATTEPQKIPATILSRCQRFDFKRVTPPQIQKRLELICDAESIEHESGTLDLIARAADGSMRDALSLLDQVIAFSGNHLTLNSVRDGMGLIENELILTFVQALLSKNPKDALGAISASYEQGHDLKLLVRSVLEALHELILMASGCEEWSKSSLFSEEERNRLKQWTSFREIEELELMFQAFHQGLEWVSKSAQPQIVLNVIAIKCATAEALIPIATVHSTEARSQDESLHSGVSLGQQGASSKDLEKKKPTSPPLTAASQGPNEQTNLSEPEELSSSHDQQASLEARPRWTPPKEALKSQSSSASTIPKPSDSSNSSMSEKKAHSDGLKKKTPPFPVDQPRTWEGFVSYVHQHRPLLSSLLEYAVETELPKKVIEVTASTPKTLKIYFRSQDQYKIEQLQSPTYSQQIRTYADHYFKIKCHLEFLMKESEKESLAQVKQKRRDSLKQKAMEAVKNDPVIQEARSLFGGELGPIEILQPPKTNLPPSTERKS